MEIYLIRLKDNGTSTIGELHVKDKIFFTLEDSKRDIKIYGKTRIPSGRYKITLRKRGKLHDKYSKKFDFHKGMLWLRDVKDFEYIYIHTGNKAEDTNGCILVGNKIINNNFIGKSVEAYTELYKLLINVIDKNEDVYINIIDNK